MSENLGGGFFDSRCIVSSHDSALSDVGRRGPLHLLAIGAMIHESMDRLNKAQNVLSNASV